jgi:hypothetical protein
MNGDLSSAEFDTLVEILKDRLEEIRGEILDSETFSDRLELKRTEEALRKMLTMLEHPELSSVFVA